jgi:hypothetical protein
VKPERSLSYIGRDALDFGRDRDRLSGFDRCFKCDTGQLLINVETDGYLVFDQFLTRLLISNINRIDVPSEQVLPDGFPGRPDMCRLNRLSRHRRFSFMFSGRSGPEVEPAFILNGYSLARRAQPRVYA